ncbi:MAG: hypothetical protein WC639_03595 [Patescibacteria group bacterium]|jgi:hypothetical protein
MEAIMNFLSRTGIWEYIAAVFLITVCTVPFVEAFNQARHSRPENEEGDEE